MRGSRTLTVPAAAPLVCVPGGGEGQEGHYIMHEDTQTRTACTCTGDAALALSENKQNNFCFEVVAITHGMHLQGRQTEGVDTPPTDRRMEGVDTPLPGDR